MLVTPPAYSSTPKPKCVHKHTTSQYKRYAKKVYRRESVTPKARQRIRHLIKCSSNRSKTKRLNNKLSKKRRARIRAIRREYNVGYVLPYRIVMCESGGDWNVVNYSNPDRPAGAYQIITSTWLGYGGGRYAPTADRATPREQNIIVSRIWNGGAGAGQWECK